ncbi:MAG: HAD-IIB family hydrolase [Pseudomonadota bacterium]
MQSDVPSSRLPLLVFSDIDGTLLDHRTYELEAARPALAHLRKVGAGVVLASSKTAAEILSLRRDIGFSNMPAIVENGAGIVWGRSAQFNDGDYQKIRRTLEEIGPEFNGFGDMSSGEVAALTLLSVEAARRAKRRQFSEPGVWRGSTEGLEAFLETLNEHGLKAIRGGRFLTVSFGRTKADAMGEVVEKLRPKKTMALGDAPNDVQMLESADWAAIIANPSGPEIPPLAGERSGMIIRTKATGPAGWDEAMRILLPRAGEGLAFG